MEKRGKPVPRRFTPLEILDRAGAYGIYVALDDESLIVETPVEVEESTKHKALEVIRVNGLAIIAYLRTIPVPPLCYTCLDEDRETPALPDDYEGLMYCEDHHPAKRGQGKSEATHVQSKSQFETAPTF